MSHGFARTGLASTVVPPGGSGAWERPGDWLALPTVNNGDQKICLLVAIWNTTNNFLAFTISGACTVDWGDGSAPQDVASGVKAEKSIAWADISSSTVTSLGYRQAIVTITPQAGQNLTSLNFTVRHSTPSTQHSDGLLDVRLSAPFATSITFDTNSNISHNYMEQVEIIGTTAITTCSAMFRNLRALSSIVGTAWTANVTNFSNMFNGCSSLASVPALDTSAGTDFSGMFSYCPSLASVPALDTSAGTTFSSMFSCCSSLASVPALDTSAGTSFSNMFSYCSSLASVELTGCKYSVSVASGVLSSAALDALYTSLGTAAGAQTITVTGNYGTTGDTPSIATGKGWTVTG